MYPSLSLFVNDSTATDVNQICLDFIWENKSHKLKKNVLSSSKAEGGLDILCVKIIGLKDVLKSLSQLGILFQNWRFLFYFKM